MKDEALIMTAAAVVVSIFISLAPHVSAIFGSAGVPRLLHTSRQTLRLWRRPAMPIMDLMQVQLSPWQAFA